MKRLLIILSLALLTVSASAQETVGINVKSKSPSGLIDPMLYGQLFEHIYSASAYGMRRG